MKKILPKNKAIRAETAEVAAKKVETVKFVAVKTDSFWQSLPKPFFVLAPMANVTDSVFRALIAKYGKPDVTWTEFVSADGLMSAGRDKLLHNLDYSEEERPIVAQLFSAKPVAMKGAAELVAKLGFDGLDINMGCPDRAVEKQGGGAAMMKNPKLALEVLEAAREAKLPISVKTRLGYNKFDLDWIKLLLEQRLPALTVHLRTRKEMSDVPAHWDMMPEIVKLRDRISPKTLIIGNGDIDSLEMAKEMVEKSGCDGAMIGRGIFGKPWFFQDADRGRKTESETRKSGQIEKAVKIVNGDDMATRLTIMVEHTKLFEKTFKPFPNKDDPKRQKKIREGEGLKNFDVMKKHFKAYVSGWDGAKELRVELMNAKNAAEVAKIVKGYLAKQ